MAATSQASAKAIKDVTVTVLRNLEDQHDWTALSLQDTNGTQSPRALIRGLPPRRLYLHPDDQIAAVTHEHKTGETLYDEPEEEWVLAVHQSEKWTLGGFAAVFDSIENTSGQGRAKRITLATVHNDSTVVYYLIHEGIVKPRQN